MLLLLMRKAFQDMKRAGRINETKTPYTSKDQEKFDSSCHHPFNVSNAFRFVFISERSGTEGEHQLAIPNEVVKDDKQAQV